MLARKRGGRRGGGRYLIIIGYHTAMPLCFRRAECNPVSSGYFGNLFVLC